MLAINISSLELGLHEFDMEVDPADIGLDPEAFRDVTLYVRLERGQDRVFISFDVRAVARLECDRTLVMFDQPLEGSYDLVFLPAAEVAEKDESARVLDPDDEEVDIAEPVRDTVMLAVPQRKIAPGAEDVEIPTRFGDASADDDIADPRWEALRKLRDSDE